jgi:hypothetical protein
MIPWRTAVDRNAYQDRCGRVVFVETSSRGGSSASTNLHQLHVSEMTRRLRTPPTPPASAGITPLHRQALPDGPQNPADTVGVPGTPFSFLGGESDMSAGCPGSGQTLITPAPLAFATGAATQVSGMRRRGEERYSIPDELDGRPTALPRRTSRSAAADRLVARRPGRPSRQSLRARLQHRTTSPAGE